MKPLLGALLVAVWVFGAGCGGLAGRGAGPAADYRPTPQGTVLYKDTFEFAPPPPEWRTVRADRGDEFAFAFLKMGTCPAPCQSFFAYDEEPYGYSRELDRRMEEFYRRFLWAGRVSFGPVRTREVQALGGTALEGISEAIEPVRDEKVLAKVILARRGDRVVGFYFTQWRRKGEAFDLAEFEVFEAFVNSFRALKPSFYETL